jgi:hypothetical protein
MACDPACPIHGEDYKRMKASMNTSIEAKIEELRARSEEIARQYRRQEEARARMLEQVQTLGELAGIETDDLMRAKDRVIFDELVVRLRAKGTVVHEAAATLIELHHCRPRRRL